MQFGVSPLRRLPPPITESDARFNVPSLVFDASARTLTHFLSSVYGALKRCKSGEITTTCVYALVCVCATANIERELHDICSCLVMQDANTRWSYFPNALLKRDRTHMGYSYVDRYARCGAVYWPNRSSVCVRPPRNTCDFVTRTLAYCITRGTCVLRSGANAPKRRHCSAPSHIQ